MKQVQVCSSTISDKAVELFEREAIILEKLTRANYASSGVPRFYAYFEFKDSRCLVEDFIDGDDLKRITSRGHRFADYELHDFLSQVLSTLCVLQQHRIIHRDIKPANIIREAATGRLFLIDFGSCKIMDEKDLGGRVHTRVRTQGYASPEQCFGMVTFSSDIFSLGMTAMHLRTGVRAADLLDNRDMIEKALFRMDPSLQSIIRRMIVPDSTLRLQSAADALDVVRAVDPRGLSKYIPISLPPQLAADILSSSVPSPESRPLKGSEDSELDDGSFRLHSGDVSGSLFVRQEADRQVDSRLSSPAVDESCLMVSFLLPSTGEKKKVVVAATVDFDSISSLVHRKFFIDRNSRVVLQAVDVAMQALRRVDDQDGLAAAIAQHKERGISSSLKFIVSVDAERSSDPSQQEADMAKRGFLAKKGKGESIFGRRNWKKRWFLLDVDAGYLQYFSTENESEEKGTLFLSDVIPLSIQPNSKRYGFVLQTKSGRRLDLQANSQDDMFQWMDAIRKAVESRSSPEKNVKSSP